MNNITGMPDTIATGRSSLGPPTKLSQLTARNQATPLRTMATAGDIGLMLGLNWVGALVMARLYVQANDSRASAPIDLVNAGDKNF